MSAQPLVMPYYKLAWTDIMSDQAKRTMHTAMQVATAASTLSSNFCETQVQLTISCPCVHIMHIISHTLNAVAYPGGLLRIPVHPQGRIQDLNYGGC